MTFILSGLNLQLTVLELTALKKVNEQSSRTMVQNVLNSFEEKPKDPAENKTGLLHFVLR